jgi:hypothetical protein
MLDEESFPVRGRPTCIPYCKPLDNSLFMIGSLPDGTILCPINGTHIPSCRVTSGEYHSPYMVMDYRSNTILDVADYRCGYYRLANDILDPLLYNARVQTDATPVWVLELQGNYSPPPHYAYEVFYFYERDYTWPSSVLTSNQRSIPTLPESPYKVIVTTDINKSLPLTYQPRASTWYHAQAPVEQWRGAGWPSG